MANILDVRFIFLYFITISANFVECIISYILIINSCNKYKNKLFWLINFKLLK
ncbi:hypothetical protein RMAECT_1484 [Rickettsia rhipicephali str. Ect]|uniref:Uncharacterized protein n=1 Tax=Rickettsia rhipicephali str. Ect TaxID=1359199 RepID=A0A0F3PCS6_RICRH|nr:hypothetical protein RMAECT_1484 [Rickettsia rhipicephali str. Ect]